MTEVVIPRPMPETILPTRNCGTPNELAWIAPPMEMTVTPATLIVRRPNLSPRMKMSRAPKRAPTSWEATRKPRSDGLGWSKVDWKVFEVVTPPMKPRS